MRSRPDFPVASTTMKRPRWSPSRPVVFRGGHTPGAITIGNVNVSTGFDMPGNQNPYVIFNAICSPTRMACKSSAGSINSVWARRFSGSKITTIILSPPAGPRPSLAFPPSSRGIRRVFRLRPRPRPTAGAPGRERGTCRIGPRQTDCAGRKALRIVRGGKFGARPRKSRRTPR